MWLKAVFYSLSGRTLLLGEVMCAMLLGEGLAILPPSSLVAGYRKEVEMFSCSFSVSWAMHFQ